MLDFDFASVLMDGTVVSEGEAEEDIDTDKGTGTGVMSVVGEGMEGEMDTGRDVGGDVVRADNPDNDAGDTDVGAGAGAGVDFLLRFLFLSVLEVFAWTASKAAKTSPSRSIIDRRHERRKRKDSCLAELSSFSTSLFSFLRASITCFVRLCRSFVVPLASFRSRIMYPVRIALLRLMA